VRSTALSHSPGFCSPNAKLVQLLSKNKASKTIKPITFGNITTIRINPAGVSTTAGCAPRRKYQAKLDAAYEELWM
jgi:hypothetical protein